jgi:hypothetical protein
MDKSRYPKDWNAIATVVKDKANWTCEFCGKPCRRPGEKVFAFLCRIDDAWIEKMVDDDSDDNEVKLKPQRFTLTVAHLDQNPSNNAAENLKALCSPCHLIHDAQFLEYNKMRKKEREGQGVLAGVYQ